MYSYSYSLLNHIFSYFAISVTVTVNLNNTGQNMDDAANISSLCLFAVGCTAVRDFSNRMD